MDDFSCYTTQYTMTQLFRAGLNLDTIVNNNIPKSPFFSPEDVQHLSSPRDFPDAFASFSVLQSPQNHESCSKERRKPPSSIIDPPSVTSVCTAAR